MLTDQGLCRTINARPMSEVFDQTEYMEALLENLVEKGNDSMMDWKIQGHGSGFSVRLVLDVQEHMHRFQS